MERFDFLPEKLLGSGGFGTCNKVVRKFDGIVGCMKRSNKKILSNEKDFYEKEFLMMSKVNHINVLRVYESFWDSNSFCLFMEFASQGSLVNFCGKPLPEEKILQWTRQIVSGLATLHSNNIIHLDLKPANILVAAENILKITDFELSEEFLQSRLSTLISPGTPHYFAPEIILGEHADFSCDVFSLGVVLYELASGKHPFNYKTSKDYDQSVRNGPILLPSLISIEFSKLIFKMLQRNPKDRPTLLEILSHPLIQLKNSSEARLLLQATLAKSLNPPVKTPPNSPLPQPTPKKIFSLSGLKYQISSQNSNTVELIPNKDNLYNIEHWIFVSPDFNISSFEIPTALNKTIFIILENSVDEIYQFSDELENNVLKTVLIFYPLKNIGKNCFYSCSSLNSISLPSTLISLGDCCFSFCSSLRLISLPSTLISLGDCCFSFCSSLQSISLPNTLTSLGDCCFYKCLSLQSVFLPNTLTSLGTSCFYKCSSLQSISLPNALVSLGSGCFFSCSSLKSISLPSTINSLKDYCFSFCVSLRSIYLPDTLTSLGDWFFANCVSLQSIQLPEKLEKIPLCCFYGCQKLSSIFIPKLVFSIYSNAFHSCDELFENIREKKIQIEKGSNFSIELLKEKCQDNWLRESPGREIIP